MTRLALPILRPVDGSGNPLPSSTLTFYEAGASSVLKTVYSDSALSVSLGSTVTADGEGLFVDIYYADDIRVVWANSSGTIQSTKDLYGAGNITAGDLASNSVTTVKILDANVTLAKLVVLDDAKIITSNGAANSQVALSGKVTMTNTGVTSVVAASETVTGIIELATQAETLTGTNDTLATTPLKIKKLFTDTGRQSLAASGYQYLPGGLLLQWGTDTSTVDTAEVFNFPTTFPTSCAVVFTNPAVADITAPLPVTAKTTTTFTIDRSGTAFAGSNTFTYFALGY